MDKKKFKEIFSEIAKRNGFRYNFGGWFKESSESIVVLDLQKSNYSNLYYLNIYCYIQGVFNTRYTVSKDLIKKSEGDLFSRQPAEYDLFFDLESSISDDERIAGINLLFNKYLNEYTEKLLNKFEIENLYRKNEIFILPAVLKELGFE